MPASSTTETLFTHVRRATALACVIATCLAGVVAQAQPNDPTRERCFGAALKGANDGIGQSEVPGGSLRDYQGDAWIWVPAGACLTLPLPPQTDGTPRRAAPEPLERDRA